jgi:hypothetical protein
MSTERIIQANAGITLHIGRFNAPMSFDTPTLCEVLETRRREALVLVVVDGETYEATVGLTDLKAHRFPSEVKHDDHQKATAHSENTDIGNADTITQDTATAPTLTDLGESPTSENVVLDFPVPVLEGARGLPKIRQAMPVVCSPAAPHLVHCRSDTRRERTYTVSIRDGVAERCSCSFSDFRRRARCKHMARAEDASRLYDAIDNVMETLGWSEQKVVDRWNRNVSVHKAHRSTTANNTTHKLMRGLIRFSDELGRSVYVGMESA